MNAMPLSNEKPKQPVPKGLSGCLRRTLSVFALLAFSSFPAMAAEEVRTQPTTNLATLLEATLGELTLRLHSNIVYSPAEPGYMEITGSRVEFPEELAASFGVPAGAPLSAPLNISVPPQSFAGLDIIFAPQDLSSRRVTLSPSEDGILLRIDFESAGREVKGFCVRSQRNGTYQPCLGPGSFDSAAPDIEIDALSVTITLRPAPYNGQVGLYPIDTDVSSSIRVLGALSLPGVSNLLEVATNYQERLEAALASSFQSALGTDALQNGLAGLITATFGFPSNRSISNVSYTEPLITVIADASADDGDSPISMVEARSYPNPRLPISTGGGRTLAYCRDGDEKCGAPAAMRYCRYMGYARPASFSKFDRFRNLRRQVNTIAIGSLDLCSEGPGDPAAADKCKSFSEIVCTRVGRTSQSGNNFVEPKIRAFPVYGPRIGEMDVSAVNDVDSHPYQVPSIPMYRVDWCRTNGANCGRMAADTYCQAAGYAGAKSFSKANNIGDRTATLTLADKKLCRSKKCDGFVTISCIGYLH